MIDLCADVVVQIDRGDGWETVEPDTLIEVTIDRGADLVDSSGFAIADASQLTVITTDPQADSQTNPATRPGIPIRVNATAEGVNGDAFILNVHASSNCNSHHDDFQKSYGFDAVSI